jgi:hypothetical protein|tara:strand:+ start:146 stop:412 length:267 start_codon:yes stop_codon:yes gene_type:complete
MNSWSLVASILDGTFDEEYPVLNEIPKEYQFGGRPVKPTNILLLISDLEGSYQHLKWMGFEEDMKVLEEMKGRYYKLYFKTKKENQSK